MVTVNLSEIQKKEQIAKIILNIMEINGIRKSELIRGTHLSKTAINSVLYMGDSENDYMFGTLLKVLDYLKIKIYVGRNDVEKKVLSLF
jgi:hypothetical protein